jgi:hypothetical protein
MSTDSDQFHYDDQTGECPLTLTWLKVRDDERPAPLRLIRRRVECDIDPLGRILTSCVIEADRRTREDREAAHQAAIDAEHRAADLRTLRAIQDRPEQSTSQDGIRLMLGVRKTLVSESLGRLVRVGWLTAGKRGEPYRVTEAGAAALSEGSV